MPIISDPASYGLADKYLAALSRSTLGEPEEYEAFIVDRSLTVVLGDLPWSNIKYGRKLSDTSEATTTVPFADIPDDANNIFVGLKTWRYGIQIQRDGRTAFTGPITMIARQEGSTDIEISARDVTAWMTKRLQRFDRLDARRTATDRLARNIFAQLITDAFVVDDIPLDAITQVLAGDGPSLTRDYYAKRLQRCYEIAQDLARSGIDYTVVATDLIFGDFSTLGVIGTFTDEAFTRSPAAAIDGIAQGNTWYVTGGQSGAQGFAQYGYYSDVDPLDGVLEEVAVEMETPTATGAIGELNLTAKEHWTNHHIAPPTISGAVLSAQAPVPIEALIPGVQVIIDTEDSCLWTRQVLRLTAVEVNVQVAGGLTESVGVTLQHNLTGE